MSTAAMSSHQPPEKTGTKQAAWALGLAIVGLFGIGTIVSTVLALKVLRRNEASGRSHGNGLAVAALGVNAVLVGLSAFLLYLAYIFGGLFSNDIDAAKEPINADPRIIADVNTLAPGNCMLAPSVRNKEGFNRRVPCRSRHDADVIRKLTVPGDRFPGNRAIEKRAGRCTGAPFTRYVGIPFADSRLDSHYYYPNAETWRDGDRTIVCLVVDPTGPVKGSLKGSKR